MTLPLFIEITQDDYNQLTAGQPKGLFPVALGSLGMSCVYDYRALETNTPAGVLHIRLCLDSHEFDWRVTDPFTLSHVSYVDLYFVAPEYVEVMPAIQFVSETFAKRDGRG